MEAYEKNLFNYKFFDDNTLSNWQLYIILFTVLVEMSETNGFYPLFPQPLSAFRAFSL